MKQYRHNRKNGTNDSEENIRGKLREMQKELDREKRYSRSLEKRLSTENKEEKREEIPKAADCPNCGKGILIERETPHPTKKMVWAACSLCEHRERRK